MLTFPISITQAAKELEISATAASIIVRTVPIPHSTTPLNGNAHMLDRDGYSTLAAKVALLKKVERPQLAAV